MMEENRWGELMAELAYLSSLYVNTPKAMTIQSPKPKINLTYADSKQAKQSSKLGISCSVIGFLCLKGNQLTFYVCDKVERNL